LLIVLSACGLAAGRAASAPPTRPAPVAASPSIPPSAPSAAPADAGPDAEAAPARVGGYDRPSAAVLPGFNVSRVDRKVCDLPDRIVLVDRQVTVLARPTLARTTARIERTEHLGNRCDGPGGGHAGCSITYDRYWSRALGDGRYLELGNNAGNAVLDEHGNWESCREDTSYSVIATCSTAKRFLMVRFAEDANTATPCWRVGGRLWEGPAEASVELAGDVDRTASVGHHWVYRFPATATTAEVVLVLDGGRGTATLEVGGEREDCVAFRP
jgi:hypothetical protein